MVTKRAKQLGRKADSYRPKQMYSAIVCELGDALWELTNATSEKEGNHSQNDDQLTSMPAMKQDCNLGLNESID